MRLLCIAPTYWPAVQYGGISVSVYGLNKALAKKEIDVTVYTTNIGLDGKVQANQEIDIEGIKVTYFRVSKLSGFFGDTGWQFSVEMTKAIKRTIKHFDLVHINGIWSYPTAAAAYFCRKYEIPYIISSHGMLFDYAFSRKAWKKRPYFTFVARRDLSNAAAIHFLAEDEKTKVHPNITMGDRSFIVPVGIEPSDFDLLSSNDNLMDIYPQLENKKIILFLGRIERKKGLDILVSAFSSLIRHRKDVHLLIVGPDEGGYSKKVKKWIKQEGISEHTTFAGMLMDRKKTEAYYKSDIFVLPSYSEVLSTSILEAMYCRLPVIASDQCYFPEIMQYNAGKVVPCESNLLAEALEQLINDEELRLKMGANGQKLVNERFAWDKVAEEMIVNYRKVIDEFRIQMN